MRINNRHYIRGRFVRDPATSEAKDGSGRQFLFGRLAVEQPFTDAKGDTKTRTGYFELKVFDSASVAELLEGGVKTGTLIEATGSSWLESSEYEKDGEKRTSYQISMTVDDPEHHSIKIEAQPRNAA